MFQNNKKDKEKAYATGDLEKQQIERTHHKCFSCGSEDHIIAKFQKPPKDNEKRRKQVDFSEKGNRAFKKDVIAAIMKITKRYMHL